MLFYGRISKNLTFEVDLFRIPYGDVLFELCVEVNPFHNRDHAPYYGIIFTIFYCKIFEFNIHDNRHVEDEAEGSAKISQ